MDEMDTIRSSLSFLEKDNQIQLGKLYTLQKELEGILEEDEGVGAGGESSKPVTIQVSDENALAHPMILSKIFSHLDLSTLSDLRLVCKVWDEVVISSPEFSRRVYLHLFKVFPCCTVPPVSVINPKLATNICIDINDRYNEDQDQCTYMVDEDIHAKQVTEASTKNLKTFFNQYHSHVQNIKFVGFGGYSFFTHLLGALDTPDFLKVQRIVFTNVSDYCNGYYYCRCSWDWKCEGCEYCEVISTFAARPNLISLQMDDFDNIIGSPFRNIFQKLINCAPNLEEITIDGNFYPDLSTCKNLKYLNYCGMRVWKWNYSNPVLDEESFNLESLSKMLDQVKHSLIKLSLEDLNPKSGGHDEYDPSQQEFKFPDVAKNLEILCIKENSGKGFFESELKKLNPRQFPKLKNLTIGVQDCYKDNHWKEILNNVLGGISHSLGTISSLHLSGTLRPDIEQRIRIIFPNLINLTMPWSVDRWDKTPDFDSLIDFCNGWKLRELHICTTWSFDWSSFMKGLDRLKQTQNDIRMLKLHVPAENYYSPKKLICDLWYDTKEQQLQAGGVIPDLPSLSFGPDSMKKAIEETVLKFVLTQDVTVHFM